MTVSVQSLLQRAQEALQDTAGVRWPATELARYLNDGQRDLVMARPDANATTATLALAAGYRQTLPADCMSLIDVVRNTAGTKRAVRKVEQPVFDAAFRDWRNDAASTTVVNYMYDVREPSFFNVYPPAQNGASVEIQYAQYPADVATPGGAAYTTATGNITLQDQWASALLDYVLYKAYSKDAEFGGNSELAKSYSASFSARIGAQGSGRASVQGKE